MPSNQYEHMKHHAEYPHNTEEEDKPKYEP